MLRLSSSTATSAAAAAAQMPGDAANAVWSCTAPRTARKLIGKLTGACAPNLLRNQNITGCKVTEYILA